MDLKDLITETSILPSLKISSKKQAIQALAEKASHITGLDERQIFDVLLERERLGSTGVGQGVAIPHGKMSELDRITGVFARLEKPIDFDAVDGQPVDVAFLLLAPEAAGTDHLKALAKIARVMRKPEIINKLRVTSDRDAIYSILMSSPQPAASNAA